MDRQALGLAVRRGAWAVTICHIASQIISFIVLAVLYRLIVPEDFGIFAMALLIVNFARIVATWGLGIASVQDQQLTEDEQSQLFHHGLRVAGWTTLAMIALAWPAATFFREPVLKEIVVPLAITLLIAAAGTQHQSRLERKLLLGRLATCRLVAQLIGAIVAVAIALGGYGLWALVGQYSTEALSLVALLWIAEPWRPGRKNSGNADIQRFRTFGRQYTASSLMFWVAQNMDTLVIGRLGGDRALGLYSQAFNLVMKPVLLVTTPVTSVMLPTLAQAVRQPAEYQRLLVSFYRFVGILLLPCSMGVFILADDVMLLLGGDQWREAGVLLRALAPVIAVQGFINIAGSVFAAAGRADRLFKAAVAIALLLCLGIAAGWWLGMRFDPSDLGGTWGVAVAYSAVTVGVIFLPYLWFCLRTVDVPVREVLTALSKPAVASLLMGAAVGTTWSIAAAAIGSTPIVRLVVGIVTGVLVYGIIMRRELIALLSSAPTNVKVE